MKSFLGFVQLFYGKMATSLKSEVLGVYAIFAVCLNVLAKKGQQVANVRR